MLYIVGKNYYPFGEDELRAHLECVFHKQMEESNQFNNLLKKTAKNNNEDLENFFFLINENEIIGCCGFTLQIDSITQESIPCINTLYIKEDYRGHNYGQLLINHVTHLAKVKGFDSAYVMSENSDYYTSQNWTEVNECPFGCKGKAYYKNLNTCSYYFN